MGLFKSKNTVEFRVPDMSCGHCEAKVSGALKGIAGVHKVFATSSDKRLVIEYRGDDAPNLEIVNSMLKPVGYHAEDATQ